MATIKDLLNKMIDKINGITEIKEDVSQLSLDIATKITAPATAEVGQTIVVSEVDENGKPTAWEMADMVSGGSDEDWELIADATTEEHVAYMNVTQDINGNDFKLKKALVIIEYAGLAEDGTIPQKNKINFTKNYPSPWLSAVGELEAGFQNENKINRVTVYAEVINGYVYLRNKMKSYNAAMNYSVVAEGVAAKEHWNVLRFLNKEDWMRGIDAVNVGSYQISLTAGTRIVVYGVRE